MTEIKPVYQLRDSDSEWASVSEDEFEWQKIHYPNDCRIVYSVAAYEALQKENAQAKEESQNYENASRITHEWNMQIGLANGELRKANEAQAKRIAELEELLDYYKNMVGA